MNELRLRPAVVVCPGVDWKPQVEGTCGACGRALKGRLTWFCRAPAWCRTAYLANHDWGYASMFARARSVPAGQLRSWGWRAIGADRCARPACDEAVESVNHVVPRNGMGYGLGCHHHQDGLEPLCKAHHLEETARQRNEARRLQEKRLEEIRSR